MKKKEELEKLSASVTRYYDSLTDEERAENLAWESSLRLNSLKGKFGSTGRFD